MGARSAGSRVLMEESGTHIVRVKVLGLGFEVVSKQSSTGSTLSQNNNDLNNSVAVVTIVRNDVMYGTTKESGAIRNIDTIYKTTSRLQNYDESDTVGSVSSMSTSRYSINHHIPSMKSRKELRTNNSSCFAAVWEGTTNDSPDSDTLAFEIKVLDNNEDFNVIVGLIQTPIMTSYEDSSMTTSTDNIAQPLATTQLSISSELLTSGKQIIDLPLNEYILNTNPFDTTSPALGKQSKLLQEEVQDDGNDFEVSILSAVKKIRTTSSLNSSAYKKMMDDSFLQEEKKEDHVHCLTTGSAENLNNFGINWSGDCMLRLEVEILEKESNVEIGFALESETLHSSKSNGNSIDETFHRVRDNGAFADDVMRLTTKLLAVEPSVEPSVDGVLSSTEDDSNNDFVGVRLAPTNSRLRDVKEVHSLNVTEEETERTMTETETEGDDVIDVGNEVEVKRMVDAVSQIMVDLETKDEGKKLLSSPSRKSLIGKRHVIVGSQAVQKFAKNLLTVPKEFKRISSKKQPEDSVRLLSKDRTAYALHTKKTTTQDESKEVDIPTDGKPKYLVRLGLMKRRPPKTKQILVNSAIIQELQNQGSNDFDISTHEGLCRKLVEDAAKIAKQELDTGKDSSNHIGSVTNVSTTQSVATTPAGNLKKRFDSTGSISDSISNPSTNASSIKHTHVADDKVDITMDKVIVDRTVGCDVNDSSVSSPFLTTFDIIRDISATQLSPDSNGHRRSLPVGLLKHLSRKELDAANKENIGSDASRTRSEASIVKSIRTDTEGFADFDTNMNGSRSIISEDRAVKAAINEANKVVQVVQNPIQVDRIVPLPDNDAKVPLDLAVNRSQIISDFKLSKSKNTIPTKAIVPTHAGIDLCKSTLTEDSLEPAACDFHPAQRGLNFALDFNPCSLNLFGGDDEYSDDETQFDTLRTLSTIHDNRSAVLNTNTVIGFGLCRPMISDDVSQIYTKSENHKKGSKQINLKKNGMVQCAERPRGTGTTDVESITDTYLSGSYDSFDVFALKYERKSSGVESQNRNVVDPVEEENDDDSTCLSGSSCQSSTVGSTRLDSDSKDGSKLSRSPSGNGAVILQIIGKENDEAESTFELNNLDDSIDIGYQDSPARLSIVRNRASSEYDVSYSKHIAAEDPGGAYFNTTPQKGKHEDYTESKGKDDGSPQSVLDSVIDVGQTKTLTQSFFDMVRVTGKNSTAASPKARRTSIRSKSRARIPVVLQTQDCSSSVGDLTATTHEIQVEIEEFKRQIKQMENQLDVRHT